MESDHSVHISVSFQSQTEFHKISQIMQTSYLGFSWCGRHYRLQFYRIYPVFILDPLSRFDKTERFVLFRGETSYGGCKARDSDFFFIIITLFFKNLKLSKHVYVVSVAQSVSAFGCY